MYFLIWARHTYWTLTVPFAALRQQPVGKVSVNLPTDDWVCRKMDGLNLTLKQGYPSRSSKAGDLQRDQFVKHNKSQTKWYGLHPSQDKPFWHCDSAKLNSAYSRIARSSGLTSSAPTSRTSSQDTLRHWEKAARKSTYICNQAAGLNRCLNKVQQGMQTQLKILQAERTKGKLAGKVGAATEELQSLMNFSISITHCGTKAMEHLSDFAFISMANIRLCRRDSYLAHVKSGLKPDILSALRQAPLDLPTPFAGSVLKLAEEDIGKFEDKGRSHGQFGGRRDNRFHPYRRSDNKPQEQKSGKPASKQLGHFSKKKGGRQSNKFSSHPARGQQPYK